MYLESLLNRRKKKEDELLEFDPHDILDDVQRSMIIITNLKLKMTMI